MTNTRPATWELPDAEQCPALVNKPWDVYRCYRDAGHPGDHAHPQVLPSYQWETPPDRGTR